MNSRRAITKKVRGDNLDRENVCRRALGSAPGAVVFVGRDGIAGQTKTGAGLGLSIAREITVAHGGRMSVKSVTGQGCSFSVILKAATAAA
ncbi:MAG: HAMP domain-containing histidine kinase [Verrucomicrobia bacterium]|nr:MAG: HAMP domain-containing histidine kinase [Verrucomicrobiota bacterium]